MGKCVDITIPHRLGQAEAKRRIEQGFGELERQIAGGKLMTTEKSWTGDVMTFSARAVGQSITGRLEVLADKVQMEIDLPEFLALIANSVKDRVRKRGQILLEKK